MGQNETGSKDGNQDNVQHGVAIDEGFAPDQPPVDNQPMPSDENGKGGPG
jgi:hypothetical protein